MFGSIALAADRAAEAQRERESGQTNLLALFGGGNGGANGKANGAENAAYEDKYPPADEWMPKEMLAYEKEALGFYISGHPLERYTSEIRRYANTTAATAIDKGERAEVILGGVVAAYQERSMKSGQGKYAFFTLEDQSGQIEFIVQAKKLEEYRGLLRATSRCSSPASSSALRRGRDRARAAQDHDAKLLEGARRRAAARHQAQRRRRQRGPDSRSRRCCAAAAAPARPSCMGSKRSETVLDLGDE
jgi:DNA polymerase III alpha subunit